MSHTADTLLDELNRTLVSIKECCNLIDEASKAGNHSEAHQVSTMLYVLAARVRNFALALKKLSRKRRGK